MRSLCASIVRFHCALHCAHYGCSAQRSVHNVGPPPLHNETAQCKTVVRPAWHNGFAFVGEAIPAWHNVFGIVRIFVDRFFHTTQYPNMQNPQKQLNTS